MSSVTSSGVANPYRANFSLSSLMTQLVPSKYSIESSSPESKPPMAVGFPSISTSW